MGVIWELSRRLTTRKLPSCSGLSSVAKLYENGTWHMAPLNCSQRVHDASKASMVGIACWFVLGDGRGSPGYSSLSPQAIAA